MLMGVAYPKVGPPQISYEGMALGNRLPLMYAAL